jgi:hypothetical protein
VVVAAGHSTLAVVELVVLEHLRVLPVVEAHQKVL